MKLAQYLKEKQIRAVAFAASIDVAPSTVTRLINGDRTPKVDLALKIKSATGGLVDLEDWGPTEAAE